MAKRVREEEEEGLDSLLDTMFNVVGILVMVLVVVQLGMRESVEQMAKSMRVDPAALAKIVDDLEKAQADKLKLETQLKELNPEEDLEELIKRLQSEATSKEAILKSQQGELKTALIAQKDAQEMQKKAEQNKKQREKLAGELASAIDKLAQLEATLDDTPPRKQLAAKVVNLPDPRPAPEGIKELTFIAAGNQIYPVVTQELQERAKLRADSMVDRGVRKYIDDPAEGINAEKFIKDFNERPLQDDFFRTEMYAAGRNPRLRLEIKGDGFKIPEIQNPRSRFNKLLTTVDPTKFYFRFYVLPDSYEAYVETRYVTDKLGYLSGWEPQPADWKYTIGVGGKAKFGPAPPPPDPNKPKPAPKPPGPKPNVLD